MKFSLLLSVFVFSSIAANGQHISSAPIDQAVVYFARPSIVGSLINFTFYDGDQVIGKFNGSKYLRYECRPGQHLFWARSENRSYIKADLQPGKIYLVEAKPTAGFARSGVKLIPISSEQTKMKRFQKLIANRPSEVFYDLELESLNAGMKNVTARGLNRLSDLESQNVSITHLGADMYVEPEELIYVHPKYEQKLVKIQVKKMRKEERLKRRF